MYYGCLEYTSLGTLVWVSPISVKLVVQFKGHRAPEGVCQFIPFLFSIHYIFLTHTNHNRWQISTGCQILCIPNQTNFPSHVIQTAPFQIVIDMKDSPGIKHSFNILNSAMKTSVTFHFINRVVSLKVLIRIQLQSTWNMLTSFGSFLFNRQKIGLWIIKEK